MGFGLFAGYLSAGVFGADAISRLCSGFPFLVPGFTYCCCFLALGFLSTLGMFWVGFGVLV